MTLIIGSNGSMGSRYRAIFKHLGEQWIGMDTHNLDKIDECYKNASRFILCTPTELHHDQLIDLAKLRKPVLCEKPITTNIAELEHIIEAFQMMETPLSMVLQYRNLVKTTHEGPSSYDYFRTGKDGLYWDCFQIIALARGDIAVNNQSPIWKCSLNGRQLSIADMDQAYVTEIDRWLRDDAETDLEWILKAHKKVAKYARSAAN